MAEIPEDLKDLYENAQIGASRLAGSFAGGEYKRFVSLIERIAKAEAALSTSNANVADAQDEMQKASDLYYDANRDWKTLKAENATLKAQIATLTAAVSDKEGKK